MPVLSLPILSKIKSFFSQEARDAYVFKSDSFSIRGKLKDAVSIERD